MQRSELEQWRTATEMEALVQEFYESVPRDHAFARRVGLPKDMAEEYVPLGKLVRHVPNVLRARLLPKSHAGADAELQFKSGPEQTVQITLAGASQQSYFNRRAALLGKPYFPNQAKVYDKRSRTLVPIGRMLQAPAGIVRNCAEAISQAVQRKQHDFSGTDYLLVVYEPGVLPRKLRGPAMRATRTALRRSSLSRRFNKICAVIGNDVGQVA